MGINIILCIWVKEYNGYILSSLHDLGNQGQIHFCMAFLISGSIHDRLDLMSILTFPRSRISKNYKMNYLTSTVDLENQGHTHIWCDLA